MTDALNPETYAALLDLLDPSVLVYAPPPQPVVVSAGTGRRGRPADPRREEVVAVLRERFADGEVPYGTYSKLAVELGVRQKVVFAAAQALGLRVYTGREVLLTPRMGRRPLAVRWRIQEALRQRFPCQAVPFGAYAALAREFGITPNYVRVVARELGLHAQAQGKRRPRYLCPCGNLARGKNWLCAACRHITSDCPVCGKAFQRRPSELVRKTNDPHYRSITGYCSRACFYAAQRGRKRPEVAAAMRRRWQTWGTRERPSTVRLGDIADIATS